MVIRKARAKGAAARRLREQTREIGLKFPRDAQFCQARKLKEPCRD
jgi:hypothetical protein